MANLWEMISSGLYELAFPHVCEICGLSLPKTNEFVCSDCLSSRFELARIQNRLNNPEILLPEGVSVQFALWKFDKGGYLQDLLHKLKYNRMYGVGLDLGRALGQRFQTFIGQFDTADWLLVPVPLHHAKEKKRGFNQAYYLAKGMAKLTGLPIIQRNAVERVKNTKSQTGFSLEKRKQNIEKAFRVCPPNRVINKTCVIVDDVFTTGATSFELATVLLNAGARKIIITTVAEA
jgi:ComF family protein